MHIYATFSFLVFNQALKSYMKKQYKEEFFLNYTLKILITINMSTDIIFN